MLLLVFASVVGLAIVCLILNNQVIKLEEKVQNLQKQLSVEVAIASDESEVENVEEITLRTAIFYTWERLGWIMRHRTTLH